VVGVVVAVVIVVGFAALVAFGRREREVRRAAAATVALVVDDWGVKRALADGRREEIAWDEVRAVRLLTLPRGPWGDRARLILDGDGERGCIVPFEVAEPAGLVTAVAGLPGFDHRAMAGELERQRTGTVVLWQRTAPST
jgi:hypothetical protein